MIKYTHACVRLVDGDRSLLIDPGTWAEDDAFAGATDVLITHIHADHMDVERLSAQHAKNPALRVYLPAEVAIQATEQAPSLAPALTVVSVGDAFLAAGFAVRAVGGRHATIYDGAPDVANIGYVIDDTVYHPGDSTFVPDGTIPTLLVPTMAPWLKLAEAIDFIRAVRPAQAFSIHDAMLSPRGEMGVDRWLAGKGEADYGRIKVGDSVEL